MTQRLCRACDGWHDLNEPWPRKCGGHFRVGAFGSSLQIIKDIEPYKAVAADVDGKVPVIAGRRQHREFLRRNGYVEVGSDVQTQPKRAEYDLTTGNDIRRAIQEIKNR